MIDDIKIYWIDSNNNTTDISKHCGDLEWSEEQDRHTMELSFCLSDTDERYLERYQIVAGDKIQFIYTDYKGVEKAKYYFIVTTVSRDYPKRTITAKDYCFYIEQNDVVIQFSNVTGKKAIEQLAAKLGIGVNCCDLDVNINEIYMDSAEDIIDDILDKQKKKNGCKYDYRMDMMKLKIYKYPESAEVYSYKPAINVNEIDVTLWHGNVSYEHTIDDMKNSVIAIVKKQIRRCTSVNRIYYNR